MVMIKKNFSEILAATLAGEGVTVLSAYRRNINLRDLLVHSHLPVIRERLGGTKQQRTLKIWVKQEAFYLPRIGLATKNCFYAIWCARCGKQCKKQYVGQTGNVIRTRLYQHRYTM